MAMNLSFPANKGAAMSTDNDFSEMFPQEQWGNFLTPEEQEVFFE